MSKGFKIKSPGTGEIFAERSYARDKEIEKALTAARRAQQDWRKTDFDMRKKICLKAVDFFLAHCDEIALEITLMMGRPIRYSPLEIKNGLRERATYMIDIAQSALSDIPTIEKPGFKRFIRKDPLGTVLVLAPWNYPYLTSVNAIFPAIMAGNCVILKHAEQTALCAERYLDAFRSAGLPDGVFQFLHIDHDQVAAVLPDKRINFVAFTGSVDGGRAVQRALKGKFIDAGFELGGKDPAYVAADANLKGSVENLVDGAFFNSGQSCCGIERIYVHEDRFDDFIEDFVKLTRTYNLADPTDPETTLGPMVRKRNARKVIDHIEQAVSMGAVKLIKSREFPNMDLPYLPPQVMIDVNHEMDLMREETFGPVVGIMPVKSDEEAIKLMNDSIYGLTASIWTGDMERALHMGDRIQTGTWYMNRCDYLDPELAWTGIKNSGKGCTLSSLGYDQLTRPKSFHMKLK